MDVKKLIIFLCIKVTSALEKRTLAYIPEMSSVTLPEFWEMTGITQSASSIRSNLVDLWTWWTPQVVQLRVNDVNGKSLGILRLDTSSSTQNLTDMFADNRRIKTELFTPSTPYKVYIRQDGELILADSNNMSLVYLAHLRRNSTSTINCFAKNGTAFTLSDVIGVLQNQKEVIYTEKFEDHNVFTQLKIRMPEGIRYMNGVSVNNSDAKVKYKIGYSNWDQQCNRDEYIELVNKYAYDCDGTLQDTGKISNVKVACLWLFFNESVTTVDVTVYGPAEDFVLGKGIQVVGLYGEEPSTFSHPSTAEADTSPVTISNDIIELSSTLTSSDLSVSTTAPVDTSSAIEETFSPNPSSAEADTSPVTIRNDIIELSSTLTSSDLSVSTTAPVITSATMEDTSPTKIVTSATSESTNQNIYVLNNSTCTCYSCNSKILSDTEKQQIKDKIKKELSVNRKTLSLTRRKKTCAEDQRPSTIIIGYVGTCIIAVIVMLLVGPDVISLSIYLLKKINNT